MCLCEEVAAPKSAEAHTLKTAELDNQPVTVLATCLIIQLYLVNTVVPLANYSLIQSVTQYGIFVDS
jgi:hypothetical protein